MANIWSFCVATAFLIVSRADRCVWDGTGCFDDGCDPDQRVENCGKFEQQDACESDTGKDNRCRWSFEDAAVAADAYGNGCGYNNDSPCDEYEADQAPALGVEADNRHFKLSDEDAVDLEADAVTGCVWDGTGCFDDGCDPDQRVANCGKFEQQDACESDTGKDNRCRWSFGEGDAMLFGVIDYGALQLLNPMEMTWDLLLVVVASLVFMAWTGYNAVRWWQRPKQFEYEPVYEVEMRRV